MSNKLASPIPDEAGRTHTFEFEGESLVSLHDWVLETKTKEEYDFWNANDNVGKHTDVGSEYYAEWLVSQKMIHTVNRPDGTAITNNYQDYL
jgi:hypothetical protein